MQSALQTALRAGLSACLGEFWTSDLLVLQIEIGISNQQSDEFFYLTITCPGRLLWLSERIWRELLLGLCERSLVSEERRALVSLWVEPRRPLSAVTMFAGAETVFEMKFRI
jgi:hypothetical protein